MKDEVLKEMPDNCDGYFCIFNEEGAKDGFDQMTVVSRNLDIDVIRKGFCDCMVDKLMNFSKKRFQQEESMSLENKIKIVEHAMSSIMGDIVFQLSSQIKQEHLELLLAPETTPN